MIDADLLSMLRCPADGSQLEIADNATLEQINAAIAAGTARDVGDQIVSEPIEAGLRPTGNSIVYPVRGGIPSLVVDEAIRLA